MVPDGSGDGTAHSGPVADGGAAAEIDEAVLYTVVRKAVEDAILGVIGTVLLVGVAFVIAYVGLLGVVASAGSTGAGLAGVAVSVALIAVGLYLAAATLELIPPIREWGGE
ncbi:hypothetical protein SAMN05216559_0784 [Halomicrobium zhouii]|uniref:Uncharacterized protein n=1 Tax=Halomicrobium zhouii TaxID=767519 RepID=A0A1I6KH45_9EURY|nr:hypothetical protein [Halomicrobium zhouii]SFR90368.1 hypothetical protein SAMN05216559_0784 [Halomicrobium zhouii]